MLVMKANRGTILLAICLATSGGAYAQGVNPSPEVDQPWHYAEQPSTYERSGPGPEGALFRRMAHPSLGAAMSFSEDRTLALEMRLLLSTDSQASLERHGPWLNDQGLSNNAHHLIHHIEGSAAHGLASERYELTKLIGLRALLNRMLLNPSISEARIRAIRSVLSSSLEQSFIRLATDLGSGAIAARQVQWRLFRDPPKVDMHALLSELASGTTDVPTILETLTPQSSDYQALTSYMGRLLSERNSDELRIDVQDNKVRKAGQRAQPVFKAKQRLVQIGDLPINTVITPMFDAYFKVALQGFQTRHGLEPSGELNRRTRDAMNVSVEQEIERVAMSLERLRWMPRDRGARHVIVNLPSYRLQLMEQGQPIIDMPVVVGSTKHPTPTFSQDLSYIEFNPTWTVPRSITEAELLPKELDSPGYLKERNFQFLSLVDGRLKEVPYDSVTPEMMVERPFGFTLRQSGGPRNALGRMKFMMPNPYSIYLHDTPAKRHFGLTDRAYSHGCIRLSDPDQLARTLLDLDARPHSEISRILDSTGTQRSRLRQRVPTHLTYLTSWVGADDRLHHAPDIYKHDPALKQALRALNDQEKNEPLQLKTSSLVRQKAPRKPRPVDYELADAEGP